MKTSCQDFLSLGLKYQHLSPPSPQVDFIPLRVELRDKTTRILLQVQEEDLDVGLIQSDPQLRAWTGGCPAVCVRSGLFLEVVKVVVNLQKIPSHLYGA